MPRLKKLIMHSSKELISLEFLHLTRKPGGSLEWFRMRFCLAWLLSFSKLHLCAGASISYSTFPKDWNLSAKDVIRLHRFIFSRRVTSVWRSKLESWSSSVFSAHLSVDGTLWKFWVPLHVPNTRWMTSIGKFIDFCHNGFSSIWVFQQYRHWNLKFFGQFLSCLLQLFILVHAQRLFSSLKIGIANRQSLKWTSIFPSNVHEF